MNINAYELPTKSIKSIEWQEETVRLKEQLNRSENQSKNYYRKSIKYHKLLHDAGSYFRFFLTEI